MTEVFDDFVAGRFDEVLKKIEADHSLAKATNPKGSTLLMGAAMKGEAPLVERLIELGADVNATRAGGITALRFAVEQRHVAIARRLFELGASAAHDERPYDLLRHALNSGPALAIGLIEHGLRLDVPHTNGEPILQALIEKANVEAVRAYHAAGGALDVSRGRHAPVQVAARANQVEIVGYLLSHGASADEALAAALAADAVEVIAKLADRDTKAALEWLGALDVKPVRERLASLGAALPSSPRGRLLSTAEAKAFFDERRVKLEDWWPHDFTEGRALLLPGGTTVPSLALDFEVNAWPGGRKIRAGIIVDGDLTIDGALLNDEQDFGPFLVVLGTLTVKNVAISGAPLHVGGDLVVSGAFHGYYNHGSTRVEGALDANLFLAQDYFVVLRGDVRGDVVEVRGHIESKKKLAKRKAADVLAAELLGEEDWPKDGAIMKALAAGKSIRK